MCRGRLVRRQLAFVSLNSLLVPLVAVGIAFVLGAVAILIAGGAPLIAYRELVIGAMGSVTNLAATLARSVPIVTAGIGMAFAFRAGFFNIGGEGQMIMGAIAAAVVGIAFRDLPAPLLLPMAVGAGCLAGALWAALSGWWQAWYGVPILITSLLLNFVAALFGAYLTSYPLRVVGASSGVAATPMVAEAIQLPPLLDGTRLHAGVLAMVVIALGVAWFQRRTVLGYSMRMTGHNPHFAEYGGIDLRRTTLQTMMISGAICGLAGVLLVLGIHFRYVDTSITAPGYAWTGFTAALLAASHPIYTVFSGIFLAGLEVGATGMERNTMVPLQLVDVVQGIVILMVGTRVGIETLMRRAVR